MERTEVFSDHVHILLTTWVVETSWKTPIQVRTRMTTLWWLLQHGQEGMGKASNETNTNQMVEW
jgi:hypothetical protein